jgi:hypothetical protein
VINLHERLSEYSYGFGATREVQLLLEAIGLKPTPFLPNLLHEEQLGFDVGFKDQGHVVVLQFKLGHELKRFHRQHPTQSIPDLDHPFWRFSVDTGGHQFQRLQEFEAQNADTYYVAPRFSDWLAYDRAFQNGTVLDNSLLIKPGDIAAAVNGQSGAIGVHRVVYDRTSRYVCSETKGVREYRPAEMAAEVNMHVRESSTTLESRVVELFERRRDGQGRTGVRERARRDEILQRFKDPVQGMAVAVGAEAWSQGAQLIYVTASKP